MSAAPADPRRFTLGFGFVIAAVMGTAMGFGEHRLSAGVIGFAIVFGWSVVTCLVPRDRFELLSAGLKDERQAQLNLNALQLAGTVSMAMALGGATWDLAHGRLGEFGVICVVGGLTFILAQLVLPRVR